MKNRLPLTDAEGEVRELTAEDLREFRPAAEVLPQYLSPKLARELLTRKPRGAQKSSTKVQLSLRLTPEVITAFKATGRGWQTRMGEVLSEWADKHRAA